ncbi:MAG: hypothetical protein KBB54_03630 [Candidatus Pacebacteria bacterium]|nr:hypothetical protein [Candidatus Paceibacterota bacterium]MBP9818924.1 hypothetical protein [Candidatus Paceibacterota bacterium]
MNTAHQEYERLRQLMKDKKGRRVVNDAWMEALNYEKDKKGQWKKRAGFGNKCSGFAFDKRNPIRHILGRAGEDHCNADIDLRLQIEREEGLTDEESRSFVVEGRAAQILDFRLPLITLMNFVVIDKEDIEIVERAEAQLLDNEIGIPVNSIFFAKYYDKLRKP